MPPPPLPPLQRGTGPRDWIDMLRGVNDPLGQFGDGPPSFGEGDIARQAQDVYETLIALGIPPDEALNIVRENMLRSVLPEEPTAPAASSAASMLGAQASMMNVQENMRQGAFDRVQDRLRLLQATDQLLDARRENAMSALIQAAPLMVQPGTEFAPGFEPGGPSMQLSNLIGANLLSQQMPTAELPLGDFLDEPRSVTPETVNRDLLALTGG